MTDHELLELAAKAAEYDFYFDYDEDLYVRNYLGLAEYFWNPLIDDGDALRLAVKCLPFHVLKYTPEDYEYCNQNGYAATRRAIVRAAAEIGAGRS